MKLLTIRYYTVVSHHGDLHGGHPCQQRLQLQQSVLQDRSRHFSVDCSLQLRQRPAFIPRRLPLAAGQVDDTDTTGKLSNCSDADEDDRRSVASGRRKPSLLEKDTSSSGRRGSMLRCSRTGNDYPRGRRQHSESDEDSCRSSGKDKGKSNKTTGSKYSDSDDDLRSASSARRRNSALKGKGRGDDSDSDRQLSGSGAARSKSRHNADDCSTHSRRRNDHDDERDGRLHRRNTTAT